LYFLLGDENTQEQKTTQDFFESHQLFLIVTTEPVNLE